MGVRRVEEEEEEEKKRGGSETNVLYYFASNIHIEQHIFIYAHEILQLLQYHITLIYTHFSFILFFHENFFTSIEYEKFPQLFFPSIYIHTYM